METSDSECFESADEDLQSDDEDTSTVKSDVCKEKCVDSALAHEVKLIKLSKTEDEKPSAKSNDNKDNKIVDNVQKNEENSIDPNNKKKKNVREPSKKLGTKVKPTVDVESTSPQKEEEEVRPTKEVDKKFEEKVEPKEENLWDESETDWGKAEDNMWNNDDWEAVDVPTLQEKPAVTPTEASSWGSWGNWDVSSILSTATQSVSTLTQGISNVLESGIGVPEPEELAKINHEEKQKIKEMSPDDADHNKSGFGLGGLVQGVSHLTKFVETTGTKVIAGGLDTLETIGKKTMEVLQEGDPGLMKKRAFLKMKQEKPVLSQILREAKVKAESSNALPAFKHSEIKVKNYETLFDDHQGLVHLEALEMLSKQCDIKLLTLLESYADEALTEMQETMDQVKELCELPDEDDEEHSDWRELSEKLNTAVTEINIPISYKKLVETWEETETWLNNLKLDVCSEKELHQQAIETLAQLTALAVEQFHKTAELLLVKEHRSTADEADSLVQLTTSLTSLIGIVAAKFSEKLNAKSQMLQNKEGMNTLITNVFFEAANSSSYIQDAFQLLIPVLQVGAV